jgi:hypothetical protein
MRFRRGAPLDHDLSGRDALRQPLLDAAGELRLRLQREDAVAERRQRLGDVAPVRTDVDRRPVPGGAAPRAAAGGR